MGKEIPSVTEILRTSFDNRDLQVDFAYFDELMCDGVERSPKISWGDVPGDADTLKVRQFQLAEKLKEYTTRIFELMKQNPYVAPEFHLLEKYPRDVLRLLVISGEVNSWALSGALKRVDNYVGEGFDNGFGVIRDYLLTGGENTKPDTGTGLVSV